MGPIQTVATGPDQVDTARRPGSWESDLLAQLVAGTVGYEITPGELAARRTESVVVPLNVAQLVTRRPGGAGLGTRERHSRPRH